MFDPYERNLTENRDSRNPSSRGITADKQCSRDNATAGIQERVVTKILGGDRWRFARKRGIRSRTETNRRNVGEKRSRITNPTKTPRTYGVGKHLRRDFGGWTVRGPPSNESNNGPSARISWKMCFRFRVIVGVMRRKLVYSGLLAGRLRVLLRNIRKTPWL